MVFSAEKLDWIDAGHCGLLPHAKRISDQRIRMKPLFDLAVDPPALCDEQRERIEDCANDVGRT